MRFRVTFLFLMCYVVVVGIVLQGVSGSMVVLSPGGTIPTVIIDPGHGGFDGGAEGKGGCVEKDINLPIALAVRDYLVTAGYQVILTREIDCSTADPGLSTIREKKRSDILNRFALLEENPDALFLSIHQNKFPDSSQFGPQMFYSPNQAEGQRLAEILQENFIEMISPENTRKAKPAEESVYLLYNAPIPGVLIECGFLSNEREAALLQSEAYQNRIAFSIFCSLVEYFESGYYPQIEDTEKQDVE